MVSRRYSVIEVIEQLQTVDSDIKFDDTDRDTNSEASFDTYNVGVEPTCEYLFSIVTSFCFVYSISCSHIPCVPQPSVSRPTGDSTGKYNYID